MPWFFECWEPGSGAYICQEPLYRSESCRRLRRTAPYGLQGWPFKLVQHMADATFIPPSPADPPGSCPLHLLHLCSLSFMIGMPNRCCILQLRANQCFICNFRYHGVSRIMPFVAPGRLSFSQYCIRHNIRMIHADAKQTSGRRYRYRGQGELSVLGFKKTVGSKRQYATRNETSAIGFTRARFLSQ